MARLLMQRALSPAWLDGAAQVVEGGWGSERSSSCNAPGGPRIQGALAYGAGGGPPWNEHSFRRVPARGGAGAGVVAREGPQPGPGFGSL